MLSVIRAFLCRPGVATGLVCCLVLLLVHTPAAASPSDRVEAYLAHAQLKLAIVEARGILQTDPANHALRAELVEAFLRLGAGALAEQAIVEGQTQDWPAEAWISALGRSYLAQGKFEALLKEMKLAGPRSASAKADALAASGLAHLALGDRSAAQAAFEEAQALDADNLEALLGRARLAIAEQQFGQAAEQLRAASSRASGDADFWMVEAALFQAQGRDAAAVEALTQALARAPGHVQALLARATLNIGRHRLDEALADLNQVLSSLPNHPQADYLQAAIDYQKGDLVAARDRLNRILARAPNYPRAVLLTGLVHLRLGDLGQAEQWLNKASEVLPDEPAVIRAQAALRLRQGRDQDAIHLLEPLAERQPDDAAILAELSGAYLRAGLHEKGLQLAERVLALAPDTAALRRRLAWSGIEAGRPADAIRILSTSPTKQDGTPADDILLLVAQLQDGQFEPAIGTAERLRAKLPESPAPWHLSALARQQLGDVDGARADFAQALSVSPNFAPSTLALARLVARAGNRKAAAGYYDRVLKTHPDNLEALLGQAELAAASRNRDEALHLLEKAHDAHPDNLRASLALAKAYRGEGQEEKAAQLLEGLLKSQGENPAVLDGMTQMLEAEGKLVEALRYQQQRVALTPDSVEALRRLAVLQFRNAGLDDADRTLEQALALAPDNLAVLATAADLALERQRFEDALGYVRAIKARQPDRLDGLVLEGDVLLAQGKVAEAAALYRQAFDRQPSRGLLRKQAAAWEQAGKPEAAFALLNGWLEQHPKDLEARVMAAELAQRSGRHAEAIARYEGILADQPDAVPVLNNLAWLYNERPDPKALEIAERAHQLAPNAPAVTDTLGWVLANQGDLQRGLALLKDALRSMPEEPTVRYHLAVAYHKAGQPGLARLYLEPVLDGAKPFPEMAQARHLFEALPNTR